MPDQMQFSVISRTIVGGVLPTSAEMQSVYSTTPAAKNSEGLIESYSMSTHLGYSMPKSKRIAFIILFCT